MGMLWVKNSEIKFMLCFTFEQQLRSVCIRQACAGFQCKFIQRVTLCPLVGHADILSCCSKANTTWIGFQNFSLTTFYFKCLWSFYVDCQGWGPIISYNKQWGMHLIIIYLCYRYCPSPLHKTVAAPSNFPKKYSTNIMFPPSISPKQECVY